ncbi:glutamine amidotransferase [Mycobacterium antarcticum]|uniref:type 1 glutamine amidotransferase n=1 Tax=unclassified Mycolicibacterium TaxID=2636767 RepID=UPI00239AA450|nr:MULTISPECIES: type 1 glutamine amidotransferase [unclassified Mycolicibacterium]BDX31710.1 glutamine amidotransferase [Mycolicibacterium sp. TUM20985]GLP75007.1 glutamine amidotransferase [Mycolicibacterium sp. TUM20983]GLP80796.1 glutamine amidotransferase [Mycolicibacterium sp. TUM20984]
MAKTVLFLYNDPSAPEAMLGDAFSECGYDVRTFEVVAAAREEDPAFDVTFPDPLSYDVVVPLGSRWGVNDELPWMASEAAMVRDAQAAGVPMLGVCFGGQLLAHALGGSVTRSPAPEIGWYAVESDRSDLVPGGPWFEWHFDRFTVPAGAVEIARNASASQAFVMGRTMGLQFHPEVDEGLLEMWLQGSGGHEIAEHGRTADELRAATTQELESATKRVHALVRAFVDTVAQA